MNVMSATVSLIACGIAAACAAGCGPVAAAGSPPAVGKGLSHPFLLFRRDEAPALAKRRQDDELLAECWSRLAGLAEGGEWRRSWAGQLEARALLWQLTGEEKMGARAVAQMRDVLKRTDPEAFYRRANFQRQATPLRALALAWDWLYGRMTPAERAEVLPALEKWCEAIYRHTEKQWWREAAYNCGSIPVGGMGLLATAIRRDSDSPMVQTCYREAVRRIGQNFFPISWKPSGICWEGPNYAIVGFRYVAPFAEALRRSGGPDFMADSGAARAMDYLMHQWLPAEGCAPIGDNTSYGRRTFAAEYLLGLGLTRDRAGLWTFRTYADTRRLDPLIAYLWYPLGVKPASPGKLKRPTSKYSEVTPHRAGYVFCRSRWDDPDAAFFSFVTRYEKCNHQHYDMNSILLGGFGTLFATHRLLFPYGHKDHGVDFEHNLIVVDGGGWPKYDKTDSCGDDNSTLGYLVGLALGPSADYVRGDAKWSYRDNTFLNDNPAIRAERACIFVKAGAVPYLLVVDDLHYRDTRDQTYDWLWYAPDLPVAGAGTPAEPIVIQGERGRCAIRFLAPAPPAVKIESTESLWSRRGGPLKRITVTQKGRRVRFAAVATLEKTDNGRATAPAAVLPTPVKCENPSAGAATVKLPDGAVDTLVWQSEEDRLQNGSPATAGKLATDGLAAMVRLADGKVVAYLLGEGSYLRWGDRTLVSAKQSVNVTAGPEGVNVHGRLRTREGLPPERPGNVRTFRP